MRTKALIIIIAIVLACGVTGACFALYNMPSQSKSADINTEGTVVLAIDTTSSFALQGINPETDVTLPVTLTVTGQPEENKKGTFKVEMTGDLANALDVSTTIGETAKNTEALTTGVSLDLAASTPFTLTFSIKEGVDFPAFADKGASVTLSWTTTNWTPQDKYYLVGILNGEMHWRPNSEKYVTSAPTGTNVAEFLNVELKQDDKIKIYNPITNTWKSNFVQYNSGTTANLVDAEGNFIVPNDGHYNIYVNGSNEIYVNKID